MLLLKNAPLSSGQVRSQSCLHSVVIDLDARDIVATGPVCHRSPAESPKTLRAVDDFTSRPIRVFQERSALVPGSPRPPCSDRRSRQQESDLRFLCTGQASFHWTMTAKTRTGRDQRPEATPLSLGNISRSIRRHLGFGNCKPSQVTCSTGHSSLSMSVESVGIGPTTSSLQG